MIIKCTLFIWQPAGEMADMVKDERMKVNCRKCQWVCKTYFRQGNKEPHWNHFDIESQVSILGPRWNVKFLILFLGLVWDKIICNWLPQFVQVH